ncbi:hypothetical protein EG329_010963 [Mollisiaceae sp. DMI_Dod_QoI]|nr:hypothetical protein EG329_010963 [Helotiales sp. DMI_Dod_QoI]
MMASAGKFIAHIAALQCVERGLITLDEPVYPHLPELGSLNVLSRNETGATPPFLLQPAMKNITLRHLLSYSSGIDHESNPLIEEWRASRDEAPKADYHPKSAFELDDSYSTPLIFEPGEGWMYGASITWTAILVSRLTQTRLEDYTVNKIFTPLGMTSSRYAPKDPDICSRVLQMVRREGDQLLPVEQNLHDLVSSVPDIARLFSDLLSPSSKVLKQEYVALLFEPQFAPSSAALAAIRNDTENYAAPAGIPESMKKPPVNHSLAALVIEGEMPLSHMPPGTVTWNGMPNLIWAMHKEKGLGMFFATQLLPVDDEKTVELAMSFSRGAWDRFG